nr:hypothetical protein CFP56_60264 [Quercus suber]
MVSDCSWIRSLSLGVAGRGLTDPDRRWSPSPSPKKKSQTEHLRESQLEVVSEFRGGVADAVAEVRLAAVAAGVAERAAEAGGGDADHAGDAVLLVDSCRRSESRGFSS